nr:MAG TPA: hypothetical protein [Caudoviricetes sp.]
MVWLSLRLSSIKACFYLGIACFIVIMNGCCKLTEVAAGNAMMALDFNNPQKEQ